MTSTLNTYKAFYNRKEIEIKAASQWDAVLQARNELKVPKNKIGLLSVMLVAKDSKPITHSTASL